MSVDFKSTKEHKMTKEKKQTKEELTETLQRIQADFENYRKQIDKQNLEINKRIKADLITRLLPILDSFELALKNTKNKEEFTKGIKLIYSQLFQTLEDMGLRIIQTDNKFDPYKHEVLMTQESNKENNTILEELQKGYMLDDNVIRHSKVKIAKKTKGDKSN